MPKKIDFIEQQQILTLYILTRWDLPKNSDVSRLAGKLFAHRSLTMSEVLSYPEKIVFSVGKQLKRRKEYITRSGADQALLTSDPLIRHLSDIQSGVHAYCSFYCAIE